MVRFILFLLESGADSGARGLEKVITRQHAASEAISTMRFSKLMVTASMRRDCAFIPVTDLSCCQTSAATQDPSGRPHFFAKPKLNPTNYLAQGG
jgi:hypothetical protein